MATGLQFKENLTMISGGYPGEGVGSNGVTQDWTETSGSSGSSTVTYWYHDSRLLSDANSTIVEVTVTDSWTATKDPDNTYHVTIHSVLNSIVRRVVGSPSALSTAIFVRRYAGGPNIWTSGGCVDAAANGTHATNVDLGTFTIDLPPGQTSSTHGALYYRSNVCGHDGDTPPSIYVDEYWLGINFRNVLPPETIPGKIYDGSEYWWSHNRPVNGHIRLYTGSGWSADLKNSEGGVGTNNPPLIRWDNEWRNMRTIGRDSGL